MNLKEITKILRYNKTQMLKETAQELLKRGYDCVIESDKYVYGKGNIPILLVAHCDTVHTYKPETILYDSYKKMMWSPEGIGGDDRCGIIAIFEIIKKYKPYVLFTQDEEAGGTGAIAFCKEQQLDDIKFAIEIDRRGNNQAVFYDCGNKELKDYICNEIGFVEHQGTFTDVCYIGESFDIGIVNVSAGYYNEHQKVEYINFKHLSNSINKIKKILNQNIDKYFDYQEVYYSNYYSSYSSKSNDKKNYTFLEEEDWELLTDEEWFEIYGYKKPATKEDLYTLIYKDFFD